MNYYALFYEVVDDFVARRALFRQEHLRLANEARERGEILLAGALAEPADRALIVFRAADKSKAEAFARKDPYVVNGLVKKWEVRPWNVVVGNEQPASSASSVPTSGSILRRWSARATEAQLPKYLEHFSKNVVPSFAVSLDTLEPPSHFTALKTKSKSSSKQIGVPSNPSAISPAPTSKPPSSPIRPLHCSPASTAASAIPKSS